MRAARLLDLDAWRGALWARSALRRTRRELRDGGRLADVTLTAPLRLPAGADRGVHAVLRRLPSTCLERAVVLQRWRAAQGDAREIVIGVARSSDEIVAHAWLEGENDRLAPRFEELLRVPAGPRP